MPLNKSGSRASVGQNIETEMAHGKPHRQAVAIALDTARRAGASWVKRLKKGVKEELHKRKKR